MDFNLDRIRINVRQAGTEDLLDRVTVYRAGMEPAAIDLIEAELHSRGVTPEQIEAHEADRRRTILPSADIPFRCSLCDRPAVERAWDWHRLWGILPVFPRVFYYCSEHRPTEVEEERP
jgi:hypothetical protein